jgi:hypothetical protein
MGAFVSVQQPRIDVTILKIFSPKIFAKQLAILSQITLLRHKKLAQHCFFRIKNAILSSKIVIITLTPRFSRSMTVFKIQVFVHRLESELEQNLLKVQAVLAGCFGD